MTASTFPTQTAVKKLAASAYISLEDFLEQYAEVSDGFKYEWNDGIIEKSPKMNQEQSTIFFKLNRLFNQTALYQSGGGIISEVDVKTTEKQLRRPDIAIFKADQIIAMHKGENQVPIWIAEVISKNDQANHIFQKLDEYFKAGVQVVWHIFPHLEQVHVYTNTQPVQYTILKEATVCSAKPALDDFEISVTKIFG